MSVIVPARDAQGTLARALACLAAQELDEPYEVIVVEAGSADATVAVAEDAPGPVTVVAAGPPGPAAARNRGAEVARAPVLAFTDADCFARPGWLAAGLAGMCHADLVQGVVRPDTEADMGPFDRTISVAEETGLYETANLFVTRAAFEQAGGFREWLRPTIGPPHMAEDILFGWTVRRAGGRILLSRDAEVHHAVFDRGPLAYVAERRRLRYFADIAREVPELRDEFLFARLFLSRRSAQFDLAVAGLAIAARRRSILALALALPYLRATTLEARPWGRRAVSVALTNVAADGVGLYSLALGSLRRASVVL